MAYLGKTPSQAVRSRYYFTASGGETSLSGTDDNSNTLTFTDGNYVDVSLNGVALVAGTDYNTTTANTIGGLTALVASDVVEVVVYDTFSVFSGEFRGDISLGDNVKAKFGASDDLQIYHDGSNSYISELGTGDLRLGAVNIRIGDNTSGANYIYATQNAEVTLYHNNSVKLATTNTGVDITGTLTSDGLTVDGLVKSDTASNGFRVLKGSGAYYGELSVDYISNDVFTYVDSIAGASYNGSVKIRTANNGGSVTDRVRISSSGVSFYEDTGTTAKFFWDASAESLGIGTSSPAAKMTIAKDLSGPLDATAFRLNASSANDSNTLFGGPVSSGNYSFFQSYKEGTSAGVRVLALNPSGGNVGIGTISPTGKLDVEDTTGSLSATKNVTAEFFRNDGTYGPRLQVRHSTAGTDLHHTYSSGASNLTFSNGGSEAMRIDSSGNVGIGITSPAAGFLGRPALDVNGPVLARYSLNAHQTDAGVLEYSADETRIRSYGSTAGSGKIIFKSGGGGSADTEAMRIDSSGNLLVGTTSAVAERVVCSVTGGSINGFGAYATSTATALALVCRNNSNSAVGTISFSTTATSYNTSSDYRLKENVTNVTDGITRVKQLEPKRFNFIADPDTTVDGFLAHEAQAVVPEAVTGTHNEVDDDGNAVMQGIDQSKLVPLLTAALKEAITKIETLETEMTSVKARLDALEGA
jgi:hypothetical protein